MPREAQIGALGFDLIGYAENLTRDVDRAMRAVESRMKLASRRMTSIGTKLSAAITAPLAAVAGVSLKAFADQQKAETAMRSALQSTGQEVEKNFARMQQMASGIQKVTTVGDEMALEMAAVATNMGIMAPQMDEAIKGAIGLSKAFDLDMKTAVKAAAAALQGKTELLTRYIPTLSQIEGQGERVAFVQRKMAQGFQQATAEGETLAGRMAMMKNAVGDLFEVIGSHLAPAVTAIAEKITTFVTGLNRLDPALVRTVVMVGAVAAAVGPLITVVGLAVGAVGSLAGAFTALSLPAIIVGFGTAVVAVAAFQEIVEDVSLEGKSLGEVFTAVGDIGVKVFGFIADAIAKTRSVLRAWRAGLLLTMGAYTKLGEVGVDTFNFLTVGTAKFGNAFVKVFNGVATLAENVFNGITAKMAESFNTLIGWYNKLPAPLRKLGGVEVNLPTLSAGQVSIPRIDRTFDTSARNNPLEGVASGIFEEAGIAFDEAVELFGEKPSERITEAWEGIKENMGAAMDDIGSHADALGEQLNTQLPDALSEGLEGATGAAGEAARAATQDAADAVKSIGDTTTGELGRIGSRMQQTLSDGIHGALRGDFDLKEFGLRILDNWQRQVADDLSKAILDTMRGSMGNIPGIFGDAMNQSNRIAAASGQDFQNIWSDSIGSVANMFSRWLSAMGDAVARLGRWIWNSLSSVFSSFGVSHGGGGGGFGGGGYVSAAVGIIGSLFGGAFAAGGRPQLGKMNLVGERGPELFVPDTAGTILPNHQLAGMAGGGGGGITINIEQHFQAGVSEAMLAEAADEIHASTMEAVTEGVARGGGFRAAMKR